MHSEEVDGLMPMPFDQASRPKALLVQAVAAGGTKAAAPRASHCNELMIEDVAGANSIGT